MERRGRQGRPDRVAEVIPLREGFVLRHLREVDPVDVFGAWVRRRFRRGHDDLDPYGGAPAGQGHDAGDGLSGRASR